MKFKGGTVFFDSDLHFRLQNFISSQALSHFFRHANCFLQ
jgi:hypothetical protein